MPDRRVRTALRDALNGDAETVDPPVRRALLVLAVAQDDADDRTNELDHRQTERIDKLEASFADVVDTVEALRKAIYGTGAFIITTIAAAAAAILARL